MTDKFKNKYKIDSTRLKNYDYSQNGMYFVTICTKDHKHFFGEVIDGKMILNDVGKIVDKLWQEIPRYFPFVKLDIYQIMSNHIHGNLEIIRDDNVETRFIASKTNHIHGNLEIIRDDNVETRFITSQTNGGVAGGSNPMLNPDSLSSIIRWYKGRCSFEIRKNMKGVTFAWQPRFYDHIIRDNESLNKIREYIIENPEVWEKEGDKIENNFNVETRFVVSN
ncbi:MAG: transposase [Parcubacteria group bacterium]